MWEIYMLYIAISAMGVADEGPAPALLLTPIALSKHPA